MKKFFLFYILVLFLMFSFSGAVFAQVAGPKQGCKITETIDMGGWKVEDNITSITVEPWNGPGTDVSADVMWLYKGGTTLVGTSPGSLAGYKVTNSTIDYVLNKPYNQFPTPGTSIAISNTDLDLARVNGWLIAGKTEFHMPQVAKADQTGIGVKTGSELPSNWALFCIINIIETITDWIFTILVVVAVAIFAIAGFLWITSGANPAQQKKAGAMILAGIIGLIIAFLARLIPGVVTGVIT